MTIFIENTSSKKVVKGAQSKAMAKAKQVGKKLLGQALVEGGAQLANSQLQGNGDIKIKSITIILMYHDRVKKATYEELEEELLNPKLIVLHRPIKIPRFNMIENVNDVAFHDFDLDNRKIRNNVVFINTERL